MRRALLLGMAAVCVFVIVAAIMIRFMPGSLTEADYVVIGSVATLVSLLALFLMLVSTTMKSSDVFLKRRKK